MRTRAERRRDRRRQWFQQGEVEEYIRREFPACPELAVRYLALHMCTPPKNWRGVSIEEAVDLTMQNTIRHQFTEYDQMLLVGVRRKEARYRVQPILDAVIAAWKKRPD